MKAIKSGVCQNNFRVFTKDFSSEKHDETFVVPMYRIPLNFYELEYIVKVDENNEYFIELLNDFLPF